MRILTSYDKYMHRVNKLIDTLKLNPDHRPHDGRNTFITMCKNAGIDEYAIKKRWVTKYMTLLKKSILSVTHNGYIMKY